MERGTSGMERRSVYCFELAFACELFKAIAMGLMMLLAACCCLLRASRAAQATIYK